MEGQNKLDGLCRAIREERVHTLSSFAQIHTQSKLCFARAWGHEPTLDAADRETVRRYVPPSFDLAAMSRDRLISQQSDWVVKRAYGRVGDEVFVGAILNQEDWITIVDAAASLSAAGDSWVAQRFVRQRPLPAPWGDRYVTLGALF